MFFSLRRTLYIEPVGIYSALPGLFEKERGVLEKTGVLTDFVAYIRRVTLRLTCSGQLYKEGIH